MAVAKRQTGVSLSEGVDLDRYQILLEVREANELQGKGGPLATGVRQLSQKGREILWQALS